MKFEKVTAENFLGIQNKQEFRLDSSGLTLVLGENGAGKSSVLDAFVFTLFGATTRGIRGTDVVNNIVGKKCCTSVEFTESDVKYSITRTQAPTSLTLTVGGTDVKGTSASVQSKINSLIGLDFEMICAMMPGAGVTIADMTDTSIKTLLEKILDVEEMKKAYEIAQARRKPLVEHIADGKFELRSLRVKQEETKARIEQLSTVTKSARVLELEQQLAYKTARREALGEPVIVCLETLEMLEQQSEELQATLAKLLERESSLRAKHKTAKAVTEAELSTLKKLAVHFKKGECHTCGTQFPPAQATAKLKEIQESITEKTDTYNRATKVLDKLIKGLKVPDKKSEYNSVLEELKELQRGIKHNEAILETEKAIELLNERLEDIQDPQVTIAELVKTEKESLVKLAKDIEQIEKDIIVLEDEYLDIEFWIDAFSPSGIRSYLLESIVPFLNSRAAHYCNILTDGKLVVEFSTKTTQKSGKEVEKFDIRAMFENGSDTWKGASKGERARIDLVVALVIGDLASTRASKSLSFRFLDEPFAHIDDVGQSAIARFFKEQEKEFGTVFVITHQKELKDYFPNTVTIKKIEGKTVVGA